LEKDVSEQMQFETLRAFAWRNLLCLRCTENPVCQYTKWERAKISSPSFLVLPEYIFASCYIQNKLYVRSSEGKKQEQVLVIARQVLSLHNFSAY